MARPCAPCLTPTEKPAETAKTAYPTSVAYGRVKFTTAKGAGEGRLLALLPPRRDGQGKRLRVHLVTAVQPGERLAGLAVETADGAAVGLAAVARVISVRPLVPSRPPGVRGKRIRRADRRARAAGGGSPAPKPVARVKPEPKRKGKAEPAPAPAPVPVAVRAPARPRRNPTGYSVVLEA